MDIEYKTAVFLNILKASLNGEDIRIPDVKGATSKKWAAKLYSKVKLSEESFTEKTMLEADARGMGD